VNTAARDVQVGDRVLIGASAGVDDPYIATVTGTATRGGVTYLWLDDSPTDEGADVIFNHGDPVNVLPLDLIHVNVNEEAVPYGASRDHDDALALLRQFPNDVIVTVVAGTVTADTILAEPDETSSASRQHYIDTGRYLTWAETLEGA
jgi:hypothetical protein